MHHWDRDTSGRLQRISTPVEQGYEVSVHSDQMDPLPEEQQSQQGTPVNPTAYKSIRDHIHPPRVSAPSCIIPQAEFLKKFFSATKTNSLKKQIYTYSAYDNEKFYQCWERFVETINACPHHGFDTWMLVNHFYNGMSPAMKQLLETMCGDDFLSNHPDEAMDFLNYVAETSKGWNEPNPREMDKMRPSAHQMGGIFTLSEDMEMKAKISTLARKVEELEGKRLHEV